MTSITIRGEGSDIKVTVNRLPCDTFRSVVASLCRCAGHYVKEHNKELVSDVFCCFREFSDPDIIYYMSFVHAGAVRVDIPLPLTTAILQAVVLFNRGDSHRSFASVGADNVKKIIHVIHREIATEQHKYVYKKALEKSISDVPRYDRYVSFHEDGSFQLHKTEEEAVKECEKTMKECAPENPGEDSELMVGGTGYAKIVQRVVEHEVDDWIYLSLKNVE